MVGCVKMRASGVSELILKKREYKGSGSAAWVLSVFLDDWTWGYVERGVMCLERRTEE